MSYPIPSQLTEDERIALNKFFRDLADQANHYVPDITEIGDILACIANNINTPVIPGQLHDLQSGVAMPLLTVNLLQTIFLPEDTPDNSFGCKLFFAVECTDGTDVQIREGDVNAAVARKSDGTYATAQAVNATGALTSGTTLTVTFDWTTTPTTATLRATATSNLGAPTDFKIHYFLLHATHRAFVYV